MRDFSALRSMVNLFLTDSCTITTPTAPVFDPEDGYTQANADTVYAGACRVTVYRGANEVQAGDAPVTERRLTVYLPADAGAFEVNQIVTVATSNDAYLVGRPLRIVDVQGETDAVYRKLECEDLIEVAVE